MLNKLNKNLRLTKCPVCKNQVIPTPNTSFNQNLVTIFLILKIAVFVLNHLPQLYDNFHLFF